MILIVDNSVIVISPQGGEPSLHPWLQKQRGENFLNLVKVKVTEAPFSESQKAKTFRIARFLSQKLSG